MDRLAMLFIAVVEVATVLAIIATGASYLYRRTARRLRQREEIERRVHGQRSHYHHFVLEHLEALRARLSKLSDDIPPPVRHFRKPPSGLAPERLLQSLQLEYLEFEHLSTQTAEGAFVDFWAMREEETRKLVESLGKAEAFISQLEKAPAGGADTDAKGIQRLQHRLALRDRQIRQLKAQLNDVRAYRARFRALHGHVRDDAVASRKLAHQLRGTFGKDVEPFISGYESNRQRLDQFLASPEIAPFSTQSSADELSEHHAHRSKRRDQLMQVAESRVDQGQAALRRLLTDQDSVIERLKVRLDQASSNNVALKHRYDADLTALRNNVRESEETARQLEKENHRLRRMLRNLKQRNEAQAQAVNDIADLERTVDQFARQAGAMRDRIKAMESNLKTRVSQH